MNILIVDDNRDLADGLADILAVDGHQVTVVHSGEAAVTESRRGFDLTFLDVKLPGIDGLETCRAIRELEPQANVVMMTGFAFDRLLDQALGAGALCVLHKPFEVEQVLGTLREVRERENGKGSAVAAARVYPAARRRL